MVCLTETGETQSNENYVGLVLLSIFILVRGHISLIILLLWQFFKPYCDVLKYNFVSLIDIILNTFPFLNLKNCPKNSISFCLSNLQIGYF